MATSAQVQQLYVGLLGRAADQAGLNYWLSELNATPAKLTLENLRANIVNSQPEYQAIFGSLSRVDTVTKIYNNLFGRAPDATGLAYWSTGAGATVNIDQLTVAFINGAAAADAQALTNKTLVADVYTTTAAANFKVADSKAVVTGVTTDFATVGTALAKLTDGSLSGIALSAAVVNLKASVSADAAVTAYEGAQLAALKALAVQIQTLSTSTLLTDTAADTTVTTYAAANTDVSGDLTAARGALGTTAALTAEAATKATTLSSKDTAFRTAEVGAVDKINTYKAAFTADAANTAVAASLKTEVTSTLAAFGANPANATVWNKALADAGGAVDAAGIYTFLTATTTTAAQVTTVANNFTGVTAFTAFGAAAAKDKLDIKAAADLAAATTAVNATVPGQEWKTAYDADALVKAQVSASTSLDALAASYKTINDGYTALTTAQTAATAKLDAADVGAVAAGTVTFTGDTTAQVFYFPSKKVDGSDGSVTLNGTVKDSLYIGEGYTLKTGAALTATGITGADNNALEVFFFKDGGVVKAVIEASVAASLTVTNATLPVAADNVSVITLTGVTDVSQVAFANGVISFV